MKGARLEASVSSSAPDPETVPKSTKSNPLFGTPSLASTLTPGAVFNTTRLTLRVSKLAWITTVRSMPMLPVMAESFSPVIAA